MRPTVYVVNAYMPYGGTFMTYHVARILHLDFGYDVCVLTDNPNPDQSHMHGIFSYDPVFPCKPIAEAQKSIAENDIFICNPSFSAYNFGLKLSGIKIMYIQGFNTFSVLDRFFDHYVTVSDFTHDYIKHVYDLDTHVIPAFIRDNLLQSTLNKQPAADWNQRPPFSLSANYFKGDLSHKELLLSRIRKILKAKDGNLEAAIDWQHTSKSNNTKVPQNDFIANIGASRYFLTLSTAEGFGLVPLEAMAMGAVVVGFDGFGGRHYMKPGINCAVSHYPNLADVADQIIKVMRNPEYARSLASAGVDTAAQYSYARFRKAWVQELSRILNKRPA